MISTSVVDRVQSVGPLVQFYTLLIREDPVNFRLTLRQVLVRSILPCPNPQRCYLPLPPLTLPLVKISSTIGTILVTHLLVLSAPEYRASVVLSSMTTQVQRVRKCFAQIVSLLRILTPCSRRTLKRPQCRKNDWRSTQNHVLGSKSLSRIPIAIFSLPRPRVRPLRVS